MTPVIRLAEVDEDLRDLLPGYLTNRKKELVTLRQALEQGDFQVIENIGHKLRGNAESYGFTELGTWGAKLESLSKTRDFGSIPKVIDLIEAYLNEVRLLEDSHDAR